MRATALGILAILLFALPNYEASDLTNLLALAARSLPSSGASDFSHLFVLSLGSALSGVTTYLSARWE